MFEIKNLKKAYKTKKIVVQAVNNVSLKLQDTGMVFLMGKSGSGKSTMLNLIGGLDKYDSGEIIFKGVSTKKFKQKDFDSFRNAYVGFVFQEYNLLNEFSVGANIGLALELQGKKYSDDDINKILHDVELDGYGNRKISELSGGQKQRVAIARALVKNPEVILADEPTGALDSSSGANVLDILKKLSKDKLIIVVSHDREFAEKYGDRIIELADGKVISDLIAGGLPLPERKDIKQEIFEKYHMSLEDRELINKLIGENTQQLSYNRDTFKPTTQEDIKVTSDSGFKPIKSKLSLKNASTIARSSLNHKKFKLVITIFLSMVALTMFGFSSLVNHYNYKRAFVDTLEKADYKFISFTKAYKEVSENYSFDDSTVKFKQRDLDRISSTLNSDVYPVVNDNFNSMFYPFGNIDFSTDSNNTNYTYHMTNYYSLSVANKDIMDEYGVELISGRLPENKYEITINEFVYNYYKTCGYYNQTNQTQININNYEDIIGLEIGGDWADIKLKVVGVVKTNFDMEKYACLFDDETANSISKELKLEFYNDLTKDYANAMFVNMDTLNYIVNCSSINNDYATYLEISDDNKIESYGWQTFNEDTKDNIVFFDENKTTLQDDEIIIPVGYFSYNYNGMYYDLEDLIAQRSAEFRNKEVTLTAYPEEKDPIKTNLRIVGYTLTQSNQMLIINENVLKNYANMEHVGYDILYSTITNDKYNDLYSLLNENLQNERYNTNDEVLSQLESIDATLSSLSRYIFYLSLFFAAFSGLLLGSYISTSISYKKRDIGILRAIGARQVDVLKIFFTESFYIAQINFVFSLATTILLMICIDKVVRGDLGLNVSVITFSPLTAIELFGITLLVTFLGSFIPVKNIASKKPIEAIRSE